MTNSMTFFQIDKNGNKNPRVKVVNNTREERLLATRDRGTSEARESTTCTQYLRAPFFPLFFFYERVRSKMQYDYTDYI